MVSVNYIGAVDKNNIQNEASSYMMYKIGRFVINFLDGIYNGGTWFWGHDLILSENELHHNIFF